MLADERAVKLNGCQFLGEVDWHPPSQRRVAAGAATRESFAAEAIRRAGGDARPLDDASTAPAPPIDARAAASHDFKDRVFSPHREVRPRDRRLVNGVARNFGRIQGRVFVSFPLFLFLLQETLRLCDID